MGAEQRGFMRVPLPFHASCRPYGALEETWHQVALLDLSAGGMSFTSEDLFEPNASWEPNASLEIKIQLPTDPGALILRGALRRRKVLATNVVEYGAEFMKLSPEQQAKIDQLVQFLRKRS